METNEKLNLQVNQMNQILEQYRANMFTTELKFNLVLKMLEEKGILAKGEFETRWPQYLKTDIGVVGQDGIMDGSLAVHFYG